MKTGIVVEGGGMKGMYSAGILDAMLVDELEFDYGIGVSAGAGNLMSFAAKQLKRNYRFYTEYVTDDYYLGLKSYLHDGNFMGVPYIYGTLTKDTGKDPLDYSRMIDNPMEARIVATDIRLGLPRYFRKEEMKRNDYRILMASSSLPVFSKPIEIEHHLYCDGGVTDSIPVKRAIADGCDRVVVLLMRPKGYVKEPEGHRNVYARRLKKYPKLVEKLDQRHVMYNEELRLCHQLQEEGRAVVIQPDEPLEIGTISKNRKKIIPLYHLGIEDYKKNRGLIYKMFELGDKPLADLKEL